MDQDSVLLVERSDDGIWLLRLHRPAQRNALNLKLLTTLAGTLAEAEKDENCRCIVIAGDETAFAAGGDLTEMSKLSPTEAWLSERNTCWAAINGFTKPLVAAIEGLAYGGGCELALACDIVVAGKGARFCLPEIKLSIVPGRGGTQRLAQVAGKGNAMLAVLTGRPMSAEDGSRIGLVNLLCEQGEALDSAMEVARDIARKSPAAVQLGKRLVKYAAEHTLQEGFLLETWSFNLLSGTDESIRGMKSVLERGARKPQASS